MGLGFGIKIWCLGFRVFGVEDRFCEGFELQGSTVDRSCVLVRGFVS